MIIVKDFPEENILGFQLQGTINEEGIETLRKAMHDKVEKHGRIKLFGIFDEFNGWDTIRSLITTMKVKFMSWKGIEKYAVISDTSWIRKGGPIADIFTPHFEVRAFKEEEEAMEWLREPADSTVKHGVTQLQLLDSDRIVGFAIVGKLVSEDYKLMNEVFEAHLKKHDKIRLYLEIIQFEGLSFSALWDDLKTEIKHYKHFDKAVIVGKKGITSKLTELGNLLTPGIDMKFFELEKREVALEWLR